MPMHTLTKAEQQERKALIVKARRDRTPWDAIAATWDITPQRAHQIYRAALDEFPAVQVAEHREEETGLIDRAIVNLLAIAEDDSPTASQRTRVEAWSAIRGWCEHKARLLGLNAPVRREVTVLSESVVDQALAEVAAEHARKAAELEALDKRAEQELVELGVEV